MFLAETGKSEKRLKHRTLVVSGMQLLGKLVDMIRKAHLSRRHGTAHQLAVQHVFLAAAIAKHECLGGMDALPEVFQQGVVEARDGAAGNAPFEPVGRRAR